MRERVDSMRAPATGMVSLQIAARGPVVLEGLPQFVLRIVRVIDDHARPVAPISVTAVPITAVPIAAISVTAVAVAAVAVAAVAVAAVAVAAVPVPAVAVAAVAVAAVTVAAVAVTAIAVAPEALLVRRGSRHVELAAGAENDGAWTQVFRIQ